MINAMSFDEQESELVDRYSAYLPEYLRKKYEEGLHDRKITVLHQDIALLDVRIKSLVEQLDRETLTAQDIAQEIFVVFPDIDEDLAQDIAELTFSYAPENFIDYSTFKRLAKLVQSYRKAPPDSVQREKILYTLFDAIDKGQRTGDLWKEIQGATEQRRKLVEIEERRIERTNRTLSIDQVVLIVEIVISALKQSIARYVADQDVQRYILSDAESAYNRLLTFGEYSQPDGVVVDRRDPQ